MISLASEFRLLDRGFRQTILLLPGWAADYRIFNALRIRYNYLVSTALSLNNFNQGLVRFLRRNNIGNISILGWSSGAFLASDFVSEYPEKASRIFLVSAKDKYDKETIGRIKRYLRKNKAAYLYKFYQDCFYYREKEAIKWFRNHLLKKYLKEMRLDSLLCGLDYLLEARLKLEELDKPKVTFIHGKEDRIASFEETSRALKKALPGAEFIGMDDTGHIPFLNPEFINLLHD